MKAQWDLQYFFDEITERQRYGIRIAWLFGVVWFIDVLETTILNVALPTIASSLHTTTNDAGWAIVSFALALALALPLAQWLGMRFGKKRVFLFGQALYLVGSFACALSTNLGQLVLFRIIQGAGGGLLIPVGISLMMHALPASIRSRVAAKVNLVSLLAPALGPLIAGYVTEFLDWRWLFFFKLPLSILCMLATVAWVAEKKSNEKAYFDTLGFALLAVGLSAIIVAVSVIGIHKLSPNMLILLLGSALLAALSFFVIERRKQNPLIDLGLFRFSSFRVGNFIQWTSNMVSLGVLFIVALYLQIGLKISAMATGKILAFVALGMLLAFFIVSRFYQKHGLRPFLLLGLLLTAVVCFALNGTYLSSPHWVLSLIMFTIGLATTFVQTPNAILIFSELPPIMAVQGGSIYLLLKYISSSVGLALSLMILNLGLASHHINSLSSATLAEAQSIFHAVFVSMGTFMLVALILSYRFLSSLKQ